MLQALKTVFRSVSGIFTDRLLQFLLLGVIGAAFIFAFVLGADAYVVFGVLVIGGVTAFFESSHHRPKK